MTEDTLKDIHDLNKDTPTEGDRGPDTDQPGQAHRRAERAADKAAESGRDRQRKDEPGEFSNIGPV